MEDMWIDRIALFKFIDATVGAILCWILGRLNFLAGRESCVADIRPESIRRILVIRPGGMGDMIVLLPVIATLQNQFPDVVIDLVCERRNVEVLTLGSMEKSAMVYDSNPFRFLRLLVKQKYDVAVDTEQFHHFSAVFALISGAPVRIGFKINPHRNPLYTHLVNYMPDGPEGEQFMKLLEPLGIRDAGYSLQSILSGFNLPLPTAIEADIGQLFGSGSFAIIHPGSSTVYKLWQTENFVKLTQLLHEKLNLGIVFAGNSNDSKVSTQISKAVNKAGCRTLSYVGKPNLTTTAAVMKRARLFVGADSGLAHLAVALGLPTVVLFGPSDHLKWGIEDARHAVVRKNLPCSPCFIFGYHKPCRMIACMKQISVEDVLAACRRVLRHS